MYSNKENVNILTSLLLEQGVSRAVLCPGSRNAPIVHDIVETGSIGCVSVTDERSAGFVALGMALETGQPVAVCVTSGSALLNVAPAVAEAYYQRVPLLVISADRPEAWIGQQDGQTIRQPGALANIVSKSISLPEPHDDVTRWHCNRLVNETLITLKQSQRPVHINVPISEPLFEFTQTKLPSERTVHTIKTTEKTLEINTTNSKHPMVVVGQLSEGEAKACAPLLKQLSQYCAIVQECLGAYDFSMPLLRTANINEIKENADYAPDLVAYVGGTIINKPLRNYLRSVKGLQVCVTNTGEELLDTFQHTTLVASATAEQLLCALLDSLQKSTSEQKTLYKEFANLWHNFLSQPIETKATGALTSDFVVRAFYDRLKNFGKTYRIYAANSTAVRLVNKYCDSHVRCNRGVNGIEGSLSTAVGGSLVTDQQCFCIIGDLSFFYDSNALWNKPWRNNLRIILLNNGGGRIFKDLKGCSASSAFNDYISAQHNATAEGICQSYGVNYYSAKSMADFDDAFNQFMSAGCKLPAILEVFTD